LTISKEKAFGCFLIVMSLKMAHASGTFEELNKVSLTSVKIGLHKQELLTISKKLKILYF